MVTKVGVGVGTGIVGLLPAYAVLRFGTGDQGIGLLLAARGLGALVGPFLARSLVRGDGRRQVLISGLAIVAYGIAYLLLPLAGALALAAACVGLAHLGGGAQWMLSIHGLQVTTPDDIRGRVMSLDFGLVTLSMGISALLAGAAAEALGLELASWGLAGLSLLYGVGWLAWSRDLWAGEEDPLLPAPAARADSAVAHPMIRERAE
jgi:predicted MFS family arabinose efflux permease